MLRCSNPKNDRVDEAAGKKWNIFYLNSRNLTIELVYYNKTTKNKQKGNLCLNYLNRNDIALNKRPIVFFKFIEFIDTHFQENIQSSYGLHSTKTIYSLKESQFMCSVCLPLRLHTNDQQKFFNC